MRTNKKVVNKHGCKQIYVGTDVQTYRWMDRRMAEWYERPKDGWMDG